MRDKTTTLKPNHIRADVLELCGLDKSPATVNTSHEETRLKFGLFNRPDGSCIDRLIVEGSHLTHYDSGRTDQRFFSIEMTPEQARELSNWLRSMSIESEAATKMRGDS